MLILEKNAELHHISAVHSSLHASMSKETFSFLPLAILQGKGCNLTSDRGDHQFLQGFPAIHGYPKLVDDLWSVYFMEIWGYPFVLGRLHLNLHVKHKNRHGIRLRPLDRLKSPTPKNWSNYSVISIRSQVFLIDFQMFSVPVISGHGCCSSYSLVN